MPLEHPPYAVRPADPVRRPWGVPLSGGAGVALLLAMAAADWPHAERALFAALTATGVTLLLTLQAFRFVRRQAATEAAGAASTEPRRGPHFKAAVLEALPDPVLVIVASEPDDIVGRRIIFANAAARETLRIQREGALLVTAVRDPEVLEAVDEALFAGVEAGAAYEAGGVQDRFWRVHAKPLPCDQGALRLALVHMRDETDARRMEQMRADFLANASHELRTPLASLSGFIETLKGHARDDAAARDRFLGIMSTQADRMSRLIADLLSLSRIELNEHVPPAGAVDLWGVVVDVVDALGPLAREKGVRLDARAPDGGRAGVVGDRDQIVQVVQNLVDNALKYSSPGGAVEIDVAAELGADEAAAGRIDGAARLPLLTPDRADEARYAMVRVCDHGPGIARQHLPRLTERFYRVEGQKSGERLGTGLGLAIVKHIVNRHRGGMQVESAPGRGAAFTVYLPKSAGPARPPVRLHEAELETAALRNKTVMEAS
jgi:two-component system phosphate regulon sensor histidine kinase PhoR